MRFFLKFSVIFSIMFFVACGSGGGSGGGSDSGNHNDDVPIDTSINDDIFSNPLSISKRLVAPGEIVEFSHEDILAGESLTVVIDITPNQDDEIRISLKPDSNGSLLFAFPPISDVNSSNGATVNVFLDGLSDPVEVQISPLPVLNDSIEPGYVMSQMLSLSLENYNAALDALDLFASAYGDSAELQSYKIDLENTIATLDSLIDELNSQGTLTLVIDSQEIVLGGLELAFLDRWQMSMVDGLINAHEPQNPFNTSPGALKLKARIGDSPQPLQQAQQTACLSCQAGTSSLSPRQRLLQKVRYSISKLQISEGRNRRSDEIDKAMFGVALGAMGVPRNAIGLGATSASFVLGSAEMGLPALLGSQLTRHISEAMVKGDRPAADSAIKTATAWGVGLSAISLSGSAFGSTTASTLTVAGFLSTAGGFATLLAFGLAIATMLNTGSEAYDIGIYIPADVIEFSEFRASKAGNFDIPRMKIAFADEPEMTNGYNIVFSGIDSDGKYHEQMWSAWGAIREKDEITYGIAQLGETNSARDFNSPELNYKGVPAPSLIDFPFFNISATGVYDEQWGEPGSDEYHGEVEIKYADGPVVFTYFLDVGTFLPAKRAYDYWVTDPFDIAVNIFNGSSRPLAIHGLELELEPGSIYEVPLYPHNATTPHFIVAPNEDKAFTIRSIELNVKENFINRPLTPRLLIDNHNAEPEQQKFWDHMRSVPNLLGSIKILEIGAQDDPIHYPNRSNCPLTIATDVINEPLKLFDFSKSDIENYIGVCRYVTHDTADDAESPVYVAILTMGYSPFKISAHATGIAGECGFFDEPLVDNPFSLYPKIIIENEVVETSTHYNSTIRALEVDLGVSAGIELDRDAVKLEFLQSLVDAEIGVACEDLEAAQQWQDDQLHNL